jgi:hypothetical protein
LDIGLHDLYFAENLMSRYISSSTSSEDDQDRDPPNPLRQLGMWPSASPSASNSNPSPQPSPSNQNVDKSPKINFVTPTEPRQEEALHASERHTAEELGSPEVAIVIDSIPEVEGVKEIFPNKGRLNPAGFPFAVTTRQSKSSKGTRHVNNRNLWLNNVLF